MEEMKLKINLKEKLISLEICENFDELTKIIYKDRHFMRNIF